jgi:hypothetical protein
MREVCKKENMKDNNCSTKSLILTIVGILHYVTNFLTDRCSDIREMSLEPNSPTDSQQMHRKPMNPAYVEFCMDMGNRSANFGQRDGSLRPYSRLSRPEPLLFLPNSSSFVLTRLIGPRSRPTTSQKI